MEDAALSGDDKLLSLVLDAEFKQGGRAASFGSQFYNRTFAFRMGQYFRIGLFLLEFEDLLHGELLVHMTGTVPK